MPPQGNNTLRVGLKMATPQWVSAIF